MIQDGKSPTSPLTKRTCRFITGHVPKFRQYRQSWRLKLGVYPATNAIKLLSPKITSSHWEQGSF